jgi:hypothetical protein
MVLKDDERSNVGSRQPADAWIAEFRVASGKS